MFNPICDDDPNGQKPPSVDDSLSWWLQYPNTMQLEQLLVGGLEHLFFIFHILGIIIPTRTFIFFRGVGIPPTRLYCILPSKWPSKEYHGDAVYSMNMGPSEGCFQVEHRWHHHPTTTSPVQRFYDGISVVLPWSFSSTDWVATHHH